MCRLIPKEGSCRHLYGLRQWMISACMRQVSDEAERSLLVKLKTECGYQFTSKLESMFTDIKTSRDTMQARAPHAQSHFDEALSAPRCTAP